VTPTTAAAAAAAVALDGCRDATFNDLYNIAIYSNK